MIMNQVITSDDASTKHDEHNQLDEISNPSKPTISTSDNAEIISAIENPPGCGEPSFNIGIVISRSTVSDIHTSSINSPGSLCIVAALVVLNPLPDKSEELVSTNAWLQTHNLGDQAKNISLSVGEDSFHELLQSDSIQAIYLVVPPGCQRNYVVAALEAGKHVLVQDPVSTLLEEFIEELDYAKRNRKFVQFSTMFVHQYRVRRLMDSVLRESRFGRIHSIHANLRVSFDDIEKVGVQLPLGPDEGCIRVLGRFCVLVGTSIYARVGSRAISAKVVATEQEGFNSASCVVEFSEGRKLTFDVGYSKSITRQWIKVQAGYRHATMTDFVMEHPDGLASYRLYEEAPGASGKKEIVSGEAVDVTGGPTQDVMMWRTFVKLSSLIDEHGWDESPENAQCEELANVALQTKRILNALVKSARDSKEAVQLIDIHEQ